MTTKIDSPRLNATDYLRGLLGRAGIYERTKASWIYDAYWTVADKRIIEDRCKQTEFYRKLLVGFRKGDLVFDVGANFGYKVDIFLRMNATVVAVEPDNLNQEILKQKFFKYRLKKKPVIIVGKAVSEKSSIQKMWIDKPGSALNTLSTKWANTLREDENRFGQRHNFGEWKEIETVSVEQLVATHGLPFFIKIDVEGHELSVLRGMRQPVPYLSFEVNLPEFRVEGLECLQVLGRIAPDGQFNFSADCRRGLAQERWLSIGEMSTVLSSCKDESIEVFWKTPLRIR